MKFWNILFLGLFSLLMLAACSSSDDENSGNSGLLLSPDKTRVSIGGNVIFTVTEGGKDVTSECKIWNLSANKILQGNQYTAGQLGTVRFVAKRGSETSPEIQVIVSDEKYFVKNLLCFHFTSCGCPNCPAALNNWNLITKEYGKRIHRLSFHGQMSTLDDPYSGYVKNILPSVMGVFNATGFPFFGLEGLEAWTTTTETAARHAVKKYLDKPGIAGIAINTILNGRDLKVEVKARSLEDFPEGCRIAVVITENTLYADQEDYNSPSGIKKNDIHNCVVEQYLTEVFGNPVGADALGQNAAYSATFTCSLIGENTNNMEVTVYLLNNDKTIINSQRVAAGKSIDYEYAE